MTPISQRTILCRKATYATAKKRRKAAASSGKIFNLNFFSKFSVPIVTTQSTPLLWRLNIIFILNLIIKSLIIIRSLIIIKSLVNSHLDICF